jgi:hypothetical protein
MKLESFTGKRTLIFPPSSIFRKKKYSLPFVEIGREDYIHL